MRQPLITALVFCCLCSACHKEEQSLTVTPLPNAWVGPQSYGWVKAQRNGKDWIGSSTAGIENVGNDPRASIIFETFDTDTMVLEEVAFVRIPLQVGKYHLTNSDASEKSIYWVGYFDETDAFYELAKNKESYLWIDSYDPATKVITGRFQAFYGKTRNTLFNYPEFVAFTNGTFSVKLY